MPMSGRLLRPRATGFTPTDADARAYVTAVQTADGQRLEPAVARAIDNFVIGCKADGIWSAIKASCILMGARTLSGALTPLVGTAPTNVNFVSGDYNRKTGLKGNASTKYLDSNFSGTAVARDDNHQSAYVSETRTDTAAPSSLIGHGNANDADGAGNWHISLSSNATNLVTFRNRFGGSVFNQVAGVQSVGLFAQRRNLNTGANAVVVRVNGANTGFTTGSTADDSRNCLVFARGWPTSVSAHTSSRMAFYSFGQALDLALLDTRVSALYTAIGAAIP